MATTTMQPGHGRGEGRGGIVETLPTARWLIWEGVCIVVLAQLPFVTGIPVWVAAVGALPFTLVAFVIGNDERKDDDDGALRRATPRVPSH